MEKHEAQTQQMNPFGIELDSPMQEQSAVKTYEMKPMAFPQDARWYYSPTA